MRTIEYGTTTTSHVPAFLTKLWKLVTDVSCNELISWSLAGTSFIIYDEIRFSKELLPLYFKHNNMASFVRQLNMYGFRKLSCIDQGGMHCYKSEIEFYHQYFIKGQEKLLELIKRKIPHSKTDEPKVKQEYIDELISNIKTLKGKQDCAEQGMRHLRRENRVLWRQVNLLTERYSKQQAVIQQLLPYFLGMIRSRQELTMKRKSTMALPETETHNKVARLSPPYYVQEESNSCMPSPPGNVSNRGPVIHDVTDAENGKMFPVFSSPTRECEAAMVGSPDRLSGSVESCEQAIDAPYVDNPGSMTETLSILNQNYERRNRSNSLSPNFGMRRSPLSAAAAAASIRLPSPASMPGASNSMPCFTSSSTSTSCMSSPPIVVIDEATSDVPPLAQYAAPKLGGDNVPLSFNGTSKLQDLSFGGASSKLGDNVPLSFGAGTSKIGDNATLSFGAGTSKMGDNATLSFVAGTSKMGDNVPLSFGGTSKFEEAFGVPKIENDGVLYSMMGGDGRLMNEDTVSSLLEERAAMMGAAPLMSEMVAEDGGSKFPPSNSFMGNIKTDMPEMNWMMNQSAPYASGPASEGSLENWLGQLFKSDNLSAGCSLPQPQSQVPMGAVNYV